jgi:hypothetical protein
MTSLQKFVAFGATSLLLQQLQLPAFAGEVALDLSSLAPGDAKTAPAAPKQPVIKSLEIHPDDVLIIRCPAKQFPGDRGWIDYHAGLLGSGCLISSMNRREPHAEVFQATAIGSQKIIVGLKQPGSTQIEKDCIVNVSVVATQAKSNANSTSANVQSYAGQTIFGNKTGAVEGNSHNIQNGISSGTTYNGTTNSSTTTSKGVSGVEKNLSKPAIRSIEEQSHSTVKTY